MQILVENSGYHLRNLGDVAMLLAACRLMHAHMPSGQVRIVTTEPERLKRLCPDAEPILPAGQSAWLAAKYFPFPGRILGRRVHEWIYEQEKVFKFSHPERVLNQLKGRSDFDDRHAAKVAAWLSAIDEADAVIATGGGYFTDAFTLQLDGILHTLRWAQVKGKPTAFMGQGLGPLESGYLRKQAASVLNAATIVTLREEPSARELAKVCELPFERWRVTGDDAFYLLSTLMRGGKSGPMAWSKRSAIGINVRVAAYSNLGAAACQRLTRAIASIQKRFGCDWMPLPVDLCAETGDEVQVLRCMPANAVNRAYDKPDTPQDLWNLVQHCRLVITGSYHAAVFALSAGIPVIGLAANAYYQAKFAGLKEFFGDGVRIVASDREDLERELMTAVEWVWECAEPTRSGIANEAQKIADAVEAAYANLIETISA